MPPTAVTAEELRAALTDLWTRFDAVFDSFGDADWSRKHGKDWTMSDVPYHLAYFDREVVAKPIEQSGQPPTDMPSMRTMAQLDAWNAVQFAQRPPNQTPQEALAEMRTTRERLRAAIGGLDDADLVRPAYAPLMNMGQRTIGVALRAAVMHTWSEYVGLLVRLKRDGPMPAAATTHIALDSFMNFFPMSMNRQAAAESPFALRFRFDGDGGGAWLIRGAADGADVAEDGAAPADVEMSMKPIAFAKMWNQIQNPMLMMLTRQIRLKGFRKMGRMNKVFPQPKPDTEVDTSLVRM